ncbi:hypothetical protein OHB12_33055 [Nocardia sp. NBC_01730]|nr:hypothetical protein OHB12_33055 [Nocardia sp. NBC_01730]
MVFAPGERSRPHPDSGIPDPRGEIPDLLEHPITVGCVQLSEHRTEFSAP